jgi:hypothetical protein
VVKAAVSARPRAGVDLAEHAHRCAAVPVLSESTAGFRYGNEPTFLFGDHHRAASDLETVIDAMRRCGARKRNVINFTTFVTVAKHGSG